MKKGFFAVTVLSLVSSFASADVCETKAVRAAAKQAKADREYSVITTPVATVASQEIRYGRLVTVYDVSVLHCSPDDLNECGGLTYEVIVVGEKPSCKAVRVEMTGEE